MKSSLYLLLFLTFLVNFISCFQIPPQSALSTTAKGNRYFTNQKVGRINSFSASAPMMSKPPEIGEENSDLNDSITKRQLIEMIANDLDIPKSTAQKIVNTFLDKVIENLIKGKRINISGFGSFGLRYRQPRVGRNPQSGEQIDLPAMFAPSFTYSKLIKNSIKSHGKELFPQLQANNEEDSVDF